MLALTKILSVLVAIALATALCCLGVSLVVAVGRNNEREIKMSWKRLLDNMCDKDKELLKKFEERWDLWNDNDKSKKKNKG